MSVSLPAARRPADAAIPPAGGRAPALPTTRRTAHLATRSADRVSLAAECRVKPPHQSPRPALGRPWRLPGQLVQSARRPQPLRALHAGGGTVRGVELGGGGCTMVRASHRSIVPHPRGRRSLRPRAQGGRG